MSPSRRQKAHGSSLEVDLSTAQRLVKRAERAATMTNRNPDKRLRKELANFIALLKRRWMGKRMAQLRPENSVRLKETYRNLIDVEARVAARMVYVEQELQTEGRKMPLDTPLQVQNPDDDDPIGYLPGMRLSFSDDLLSELADADIPR